MCPFGSLLAITPVDKGAVSKIRQIIYMSVADSVLSPTCENADVSFLGSVGLLWWWEEV